MGTTNRRRKKGGAEDFSSTPTPTYKVPTAGYYEDEVFEFGEQGATKFDGTIRRLARYLATTSIKGIVAYKSLLKAMEDLVWDGSEMPAKTRQVAKVRKDSEGNDTMVMVDKGVDEADYKVNLDLCPRSQVYLPRQASSRGVRHEGVCQPPLALHASRGGDPKGGQPLGRCQGEEQRHHLGKNAVRHLT